MLDHEVAWGIALPDRMTKAQRSQTMRAIRAVNTGIELRLRKALFMRGHHYRIHVSTLPGKPDIAFVRERVAVFVDSEFWHGKDWETVSSRIQSNREYWIPKIERNIARDRDVDEELNSMGWAVLRFWGKEIENDLDRCIELIEHAISAHNQVEGGEKSM